MTIRTDILTGEDPLDVILAATEMLYKPIAASMGPKGRYTLYRQYGRGVGTTNDGVTISKLVRSNDDAEDAVIDYMRAAILELETLIADSTTTGFVLTREILREAITQIKKGENPIRLAAALQALEPDIIEFINKSTDRDVTYQKLIDIATTSAKDSVIGEQVAKTVWDTGEETPIVLGFSDSTETSSEVIDGFKIDSGPSSSEFIRSGVSTEILDPYIVVVDAKLRDKEDILPMLRISAQLPETDRKMLFVVSDIAGDALQFLIANHTKGFGEIACARVPQSIQSHTEYLSDLALSCGAKLISRDGETTIRNVTLDDFGRAQKVTVQPTETVIVNGQRIKEDFDTHIASLKGMKKDHKTKAGRKFASDRLKLLDQKVISIFVGGQNSKDAEKRHYAYEDALGASRTALRGGTVPGGGTLLYTVGSYLFNNGSKAENILTKALQAPIKCILDNAGFSYKKKWYQKRGLLDSVVTGFGFDMTHPEDGFVNLVERGIVDPAESEIQSVRTAMNVAINLITIGSEIVERKTDDVEQQVSLNQG